MRVPATELAEAFGPLAERFRECHYSERVVGDEAGKRFAVERIYQFQLHDTGDSWWQLGVEQSCDAFDAITALRRLATQSRDGEDHFFVVRLPDDPQRRPEWVIDGLVTDDAVLPHGVDRDAMQRALAAIPST